MKCRHPTFETSKLGLQNSGIKTCTKEEGNRVAKGNIPHPRVLIGLAGEGLLRPGWPLWRGVKILAGYTGAQGSS